MDQNGNTFQYTTIGSQTWTTGNHKMTTYRDGTAIPNFETYYGSWIDGTYSRNDAFEYIDVNDPSKGNIYNNYALFGAHELYVMGNDRKKLAPQGWRIPTTEDYLVLLCTLMENNYGVDMPNINTDCYAPTGFIAQCVTCGTASSFCQTCQTDPGYINWRGNNHLAPSIMAENQWPEMVTSDSYWNINTAPEETFPANNLSGFNVEQGRIIWMGQIESDPWYEIESMDGFAFWTLDEVQGDFSSINNPAPGLNVWAMGQLDLHLIEGHNNSFGGNIDQKPFTTNLSISPYYSFSLLNVRFIKDAAPEFSSENENSIDVYISENECSIENYVPETPTYINDDIWPVTIEYTSNIPENMTAGEYEIIWTATDDSGNTTDFFQALSVYDSPPVAQCSSFYITLENGFATISAEDINDGSYDSCSDIEIEIYNNGENFGSEYTFDSSDLGQNTIQLLVSDSFGNSTYCDATISVQAGMSLVENSLSSIFLFPNPSSDLVFIKGHNDINLKVSVFDILGKKILEFDEKNSFDISLFEIGVYFVDISDGIKTVTQKIIKN